METSPQVTASIQGPLLRVSVGGGWNIDTAWPPEAEAALNSLADQSIHELCLESDGLETWDSSLLVFLVQLTKTAEDRKLRIQNHLPEGLERLLKLAFAVPAKAGSDRKKEKLSFVQRVGQATLDLPPRVTDFVSFVGEMCIRDSHTPFYHSAHPFPRRGNAWPDSPARPAARTDGMACALHRSFGPHRLQGAFFLRTGYGVLLQGKTA